MKTTISNKILGAAVDAVVRFAKANRDAARTCRRVTKVLILASSCVFGSAWADPCEALMAQLTQQAAQDEAAFDAEFARCIANYPDQYVCGHMISPYKAKFEGSSGYITWTYCNPQSQGGACSTGKSDPVTCDICPPDQLWNSDLGACYPARSHDKTGSPPTYCSASSMVGKPIYALTGAEEEPVETQLGIGANGLTFTYNSLPYASAPLGSSMTAAADPPGLGAYWHGSLFRRLVVQSNLLAAKALRGDGRLATFTGDGNGTFTGDADGTMLLTTTVSGYQLQDAAGQSIETYDKKGLLLRIDGVGGASAVITYSDANTAAMIAPAPGYLIFVDDGFGRRMQFTYSLAAGADPATGGRLAQIVGTGGEVLGVTFDANDMLSTFTWPDGATRKPIYDATSKPTLLTGITDENGVRYFTIGYDAQGRANSSVLAGGVDAYTIQYGTPPQSQTSIVFDDAQKTFWIYYTLTAPQQTTITYPNGQAVGVDAVAPLGYPLVSGRSQPAGSGCSAATSALTYDSNGNPNSSDGFNGNRTCSTYDTTRNLVTVVLEGLPGGASGKTCPANLASYAPTPVDAAHPERKTTTAWHPDHRLKVREAEPKKITTWVYNGQPDPVAGGTASCAPSTATLPDGKPLAVLCARYEQATSDATGALGLSATVSGATRAWTYAYNQYGQVLTETTPKQSATDTLSHTTTYTYYSSTSFSGTEGYTMGDLQSVANPLGQVTNFTSYDKAGRLLSSTDPNGTVTSMTYSPRGWLQTQTVTPASGAALMTTYAYWPTGLLETVTMPDASTLNYSYDAAHRLTDVVDGAGNKVHYVLDNVGNRTSEQVSDASGKLASSVARVFDALNRVQSATGAMH